MASTSREKKRIRVTVKPKSCPNPLFEKFLQELRDDAERTDSRLQYVYGKALKSLRKYPLVLESAKECKVLEHFGDKLCQILDQKLTQHLANGGTLGNDSGLDSSDDQDCRPTKIRKNSGADPGSKRSREYIPARRSGAYGLLMGLFKHAGSDGYLKKKELQELAQPYADVSFAETDKLNAQYYNAWSSMSTLINKDLVEKHGNPARYQLTDPGRQLAVRLDQAEAELDGSSLSRSSNSNSGKSLLPPQNKVDAVKTPTKRVTKTVAKRIDNLDCYGLSKTQTPTKSTGILQPNEIISIDDDEFDLYPVQENCWSLNFNKESSSGLSEKNKPSASEKRTTDKNCESQQSTNRAIEIHTLNEPPPKKNPPTANAPTKRVIKPASLREKKLPTLDDEIIAPTSASKGIVQPDEIISLDDEFDDYPRSNILLQASDPIPTPRTTEVVNARVIEENSYTQIRDQVILKPDEYDIVLCVDCAEVSGSSGSGHNQKESAAKSFQNCGVPYDVRKLSVGDYLWICKPKNLTGKGTDRELALPFVVERKRLDDLVSSIKDGRFKEQKFRLKHSGLTRPIYLIEEHGNRQNLGLPELSVLQAIANTLIIEKFQVHWTQKSDESIRFLVEMTKQLTQIYRGKTVKSRSCHDKVGEDWQTRLVTFKELYVNSTKSKPLSVTQMFAKQLMQLHGLSGDKAEAIVKRYPTPLLLIEALQAAGSSASSLLASIEYGKAKRKIGLPISGHLAKLYTEDQFNT